VIYAKTIDCPADGGTVLKPWGVPTLIRDADLPVTDGLIYQFELYFPPGSSGLLYVRVADGGFPVWPSEPGEYFYGDNTLISFPDRYYIAAPDHKFKVWYYNLDDTYAHTFTVRIGQVSATAFIQSFMPNFEQKSIEDILLELASQQEAEKEKRIKSIEEYFALEEEAIVEENSD